MAGLLAIYGGAFYRKGDWRAFRPDATGLGLIAIVLASLTLIGLLAYRHVDYQAELWWQFAWDGDAPRFLRATLALVIVVRPGLPPTMLVNRPPQPKVGGVDIPPAVRHVLESTAGTQPCVALLGDKPSWCRPAEGFPDVCGVGAQLDHHGRSGRRSRFVPARWSWRFAETADRPARAPSFTRWHPRCWPN